VAPRLRAGGWITLSKELATTIGRNPDGTLELPTPTGPVRYRVAATTTNFGWSAGTIVIGESDYRRAWASSDPTALEVDLRPGAERGTTLSAVRAVLGSHSALEVQTPGERAAQANASARAGLARLGQISALLLIGAAFAMAAAMSAAIWQRRRSLAALRLQGLRPSQLWSVLLSEAAVVLVAGCLSGALAGVYGQFLIDRYLRLTTGFAAPFAPAGWPALEAFLLLVAMALAGVAGPGYVAARTPARLGLQD
jgi:putative ABC transport system permease protein